jgi:hypothetical protein
MSRKELVMGTENETESHPLFKSISDDGACWLFVVLSDNRWQITRDGERILAGTSDNASIKSGVEKFLFFAKDLTKHAPAAVLAAQSSFQGNAVAER